MFLSVLIVLAIFLYFYLRKQNPSSKRINNAFIALPQVKNQLPLFGLALKIAFYSPTEYMKLFKEWSDDYNGLAAVKIVGRNYVLINDPVHLESLLGSKNHITKGIQYEIVSKWLNTGLLTSTGSKWHSRRKLLTPAFHFQILDSNMPILNKCSNILVEKLTNVCGESLDIDKYVTCCTLDVICESVMGISLDTQRNTSHDYLSTVKQVTYAMGQKETQFYYSIDWIFRLSPLGQKFYKNVKKLHSFTEKVIEERQNYFKNNPENAVNEKKRKAFLDILIETENQNKGSFSALDMREEVDTFMFEGHDTTAVALNFAIYTLGHHQDVQEKILEELERILGEDQTREFTMTDLNSMTYLEKVIKESLRLNPSVPFFTRELTQDLHLKDGRVIPETINIAIVSYILHRLEEYWPEPEKFKPERFNDDEVAKRHPYAYIPFSAGPRNCIGKKLAMMELKVVLGNLVRNFKIESVTQQLKVVPYVILRNETPILIKFHKRK